MKRHALVSDGTLQRLVESAQLAFRRRKFDECFENLESARRMAPANTHILIETGGFLLRRHEVAKATEYFERAIKLSPRKTATLVDAGIRCRDAAIFELARQYLEQAATQNDMTAEGLAALGWTYERLRRMDDANAVAERAIKLNPNSTAAILIKARLEHLAGRNTEAEARLRAFTTSRSEVDARVRAAYDLGAILDRQGRYDEAMEVFLQAKALLRPQAGWMMERLKGTHDQLRDLSSSLTTEMLNAWFAASKELQPPISLALLGGHPRSGTTLLEQVLDTHSEITSAEETEVFLNDALMPIVHGFPPEMPLIEVLNSATPDSIRRSRKQYVNRIELFLGQPIGRRMLIDKNPSLTHYIPQLARIFPEIKFLIALRDPRDVCMSCFMQPLLLDPGSCAWLSLEGAVEEYNVLMGGWRQTMPKLPNPILEVRYEDMVEDLEPVARKTLEFLGVAWDPKVLGFDEHARQKAVRSPTYSDVTKKVFKTAVGRWRNYQKYFEPHLAKLEPLAKAMGYE